MNTLLIEYIESNCSKELQDIAKQLWFSLKRVCPFLKVPDACIGDNDNLMYSWVNKEDYLECEIFSDGNIEFFYCNKMDVWGEDLNISQEFTKDLLYILNKFNE